MSSRQWRGASGSSVAETVILTSAPHTTHRNRTSTGRKSAGSGSAGGAILNFLTTAAPITYIVMAATTAMTTRRTSQSRLATPVAR